MAVCVDTWTGGGDGGVLILQQKKVESFCTLLLLFMQKPLICDNHFSFLANFCWKIKIVHLHAKWKIQSMCKPQWRNYLIIYYCFCENLVMPNQIGCKFWKSNYCKLSNNFLIVAYTCFVFFTLHANEQFLFFNKSLQEIILTVQRLLESRRSLQKDSTFFVVKSIPPSPLFTCQQKQP